MPKVTILGAGNVGATAAHLILLKGLADVVLLDIVPGIPRGKALDMLESMPVEGKNVSVKGTDSYADTADSDIVIITAGLPRKPGMSRDELLEKNAAIMKGCVEQVKVTSPKAILIIVSNPLDAMVSVASEVSGFPKRRILGMAGILDTARFKTFIAETLEVSVNQIDALVLGGHGDDMVPLISKTTVAGKPIIQCLSPEEIGRLVQRTRQGGMEIVNHLKTGSAYYAPASSVVAMVDAILRDKKQLLPVAAYCDKEFGVGGYFIGVPAVIGAAGVEDIIEVSLSEEEQQQFEKTKEHVRELVRKVRSLSR
ncbi:MAG: malate dehydrogenase [DPANN group archaeon]|nr:malate dehydrogenase [DPANN group archaeon]